MVYCFEAFELDTAGYELRAHGEPIPLERQVFDVLAYLVEHHDRLATKEELLDRVWGDRFVGEAALNSRIMTARKAIGDSGKEQRLIKTVHGRGYRFVGAVSTAGNREVEREPAAGAGEAMPEIQYARTTDGVSIAFWALGEGYPLIHSTGVPFNHVELEWSLEDYRMWFRAYQKHFRHIRYDARGSGLSSRDVADISVEAQCRDIEAVADRLGIDRFALLATQATTLTAIRLAVDRPQRVSHLILIDSYTNGRDYLQRPQAKAFRLLMETDWALFTETLGHILAGDWSASPSAETAAFLRECIDQNNCLALFDAIAASDVTELLDQVQQPTLILHHKRIAYPALDNARLLASRIRNSRLVLLQGTWQDPGEDVAVTVRAIQTLIGGESG